MSKLLVLACVVASAMGDVFMQNPRGSNNMLDNDRNQQNANRLFDSQSNNNGGYARGGLMRFYEGSILSVEWTAQHACGNANNDCQIIIQYMCSEQSASGDKQVRDGTNQNTITSATMMEMEANVYKYGMHEPFKPDREACTLRERNKGLFVADQNLGDKATSTRQDNNGNNAHGFECPEERDYYPYWHPSPWRDIVVLTSRTQDCSWYQEESQNVKSKNLCLDPKSDDANLDALKFNNEEACGKAGHVWTSVAPHGIAAPECLVAPFSRDNHLGNVVQDTMVGFNAVYNWTLPTSSDLPCIEDDNCACVLRLRYNITTGDYAAWPSQTGMATGAQNGKDPKTALITNDPTVTVQGNKFELALDTSQYGRTFQDRSHVFSIRPRPASMTGRIFNLNVRGRRGNIVQTYPATEYDFVPNILVVRLYDFIHVQWTGADQHNGAGEGKDKTDRSNIVQISDLSKNYPMEDTEANYQAMGISPLFESAAVRNHYAFLEQTSCDDTTDDEQSDANCKKLNAASATIDGYPMRVNNSGSFFYMSTRNNNFSNRSQKGTLLVLPLLSTWSIVLAAVGGTLVLGGVSAAGLMVYVKKNPMSRWGQYFERI